MERGRAADGLLVDADDLIHKLQSLYPVALACAGAGTVQLAGQRFVQDLVDQAGLAGTGNAGDADELTQREFYVEVAQVVFPCALHGEEVAVAGAAGLGHFDALAAGEIVAGDAAFGLADILHAAGRHDLAAVHTGTGADVHDIVRAAHGVLVVLHHDDRIAKVAQVFERGNQLVVVALVQADAGLVQHIQHTGQGAADLGGQADALALAAGQRARRPGQREIIQTHALQRIAGGF